MKLRTLILFVTFFLSAAGLAHADLNAYITDLNISARADLGGFRAHLGARFGISDSQLDIVLSSVDSPAEAAILFWLGEKSRQPLDHVLKVYRSQKSQGWGTLAKNLGIKPGSPAFHALKKGDLNFHPSSQGGHKSSKGNGKNKNK